MSRWIVSHVPSGLILAGLMVLIAGGALGVSIVVRRRFPGLTGDAHNDVLKFTYGFIGFVYAFFIGFVVSSMWGQINTTDGDARTEGATAVQMATDAARFGQADAQRIRLGLADYANAAIAEWSAHGDTRSPAADAALTQLYTTYEQVHPATETQKNLVASSLSNLDTISQARTVRLLTAREDTGPPWPLWVVIFLTSALVLGTAITYGVENHRMHYPMVLTVGLIVAANLFLILELSHPYAGEIATTPDPLREVVRVTSQQAP
ncbi:MAG: DUF4239 domain-containing protein [Actinobacteria bacterium]|nr:DUF4239 domain-containing protein [Actinomycetota bacterium]